jgi:hypothetical protein
MAAGADALLAQLRALVASLVCAPNAPVTQAGVERVRAAAALLCASEEHSPEDAAELARGVWEVALELWCAGGARTLRGRVRRGAAASSFCLGGARFRETQHARANSCRARCAFASS